jgi:lipoprotein Spr
MTKTFRFILFFLIGTAGLYSCKTALSDKTEYERGWEFEHPEKGKKPKESKPVSPSVGEKSGVKNATLKKEVDSWLGVPYKYGGTTRQGVDCSAFCGHVYKNVYGITLGRSAHDIYEQAAPLKKSELAEGDFVFFKINSSRVSHVGIYLGEDKFVHASTSRGVVISSLNETYWQKYYFAAGRIKR